MKILSITPKNIAAAVKMLKSGGIVAHPTDTCFGLAADISNKKAVEKIYKIKKMPIKKPISIAVSSKKGFSRYAVINNTAKKILKEYLPGKLTIILMKKTVFPKHFNKYTDSIGIRYLSHKLTNALIKGVGGAITTTSANITNAKEAYTVKEILQEFKGEKYRPDIILKPNKYFLKKEKPSTIIRVNGKNIEVIRKGAITVKIN